MNAVLLLPPNHTADDSAIWRAAIARELRTMRCQRPEEYAAELADVPPELIFYYGNTLHVRRLMDAGVKLRTPLVDPNWVLELEQPAIFGRNVVPMTYGEFSRMDTSAPFFVKCTADKWFKPLVCSPQTIPVGSSMKSDVLHVQGIVRFVDEVRCWILHGGIYTWSYYRKNGKPWKAGITDAPPRDEWKNLVSSVTHRLPSAIVVDVGRLESGEWLVIEANEPWASGIYDSDPQACLDVILASQGG